ncbi:hypothetical protein F2Q70_00020614 [Brassica cretica]|uniref:Uncharacterized protein n=1 Tax=Brassica cretica TaxID=69181 RepID=A0A8S9GSZ4_BRACR|nr:hypothetical protein F2Q70_00020614 [Brassica cretica]
MMNNTRKGYATVEDITKISIARASAINGGGRNHLDAEGRELYLAPWRWCIGKIPLGAHVKHVIEILFEAVLMILGTMYDGRRFSYKHDVKYPAGAAAAAVDLNIAYRMSWRICRFAFVLYSWPG